MYEKKMKRRQRGGWKRAWFFYLIQIAITNAWACWCEVNISSAGEKYPTQKTFIKAVCKQLIDEIHNK